MSCFPSLFVDIIIGDMRVQTFNCRRRSWMLTEKQSCYVKSRCFLVLVKSRCFLVLIFEAMNLAFSSENLREIDQADDARTIISNCMDALNN